MRSAYLFLGAPKIIVPIWEFFLAGEVQIKKNLIENQLILTRTII